MGILVILEILRIYFRHFSGFLAYLIIVEGKILMFSNKIWGSQAETQQWTLEIKPKGFWCCVSSPKQEIEAAP